MKEEIEIYKKVDGFENYSVSNIGNVRNALLNEQYITYDDLKIYYYNKKFMFLLEDINEKEIYNKLGNNNYIYYDYVNNKIADEDEIYEIYDTLEANWIKNNIRTGIDRQDRTINKGIFYRYFFNEEYKFLCFGNMGGGLCGISLKNILIYENVLDLKYNELEHITKKFYDLGFEASDLTKDNFDYIFNLCFDEEKI